MGNVKVANIYIYIYIYIFCTDPATDIYQGMPALGCHERT